jgi:hypothetical protein
MGEVVEQTWTTIAADRDGEVLPDEIGKRRMTRHVHFAFRSEAEQWIAKQEAEGFSPSYGPTPCATPYHGKTDSPSNCWSAEVSRDDLA